MKKVEKTLIVRTMGDVVELVNRNVDCFNRQLRKLSKKNRRLTILAVAAIGCAIWSESERRKQEEEVYRLSVRVKKLEHFEEA